MGKSEKKIKIEELLDILSNPDNPESNLIHRNEYLECTISLKKFKIHKNGMIDFTDTNDRISNEKPLLLKKKSILFKLNEFYNIHFEQKITNSILTVGGIGSKLIKKKLISWISKVNGLILDVGCGDKKWEKYVNENSKYISLDYIPAAAYSPWRYSYPQINANAMKLPFKNNSIDVIINTFVLEHIYNPELFINELTRVIKSEGTLILVGPGDILLSHGEPLNFFNITRYAYIKMLNKNNMEIIEEYYPLKFWNSIFSIIYRKIVRNNIYNKNPFLKSLQFFVLILSILTSPLFNLLAMFLDLITPFDKRGYSIYMVYAKKK